jgi:hypothetical protein
MKFFFDQIKYWITVVSKTGTKLEIQCLKPFWDSQMPHSTVFKRPSSNFFSFFFILFTCPAVASNFFSDFSKHYQRFLKICNQQNQCYKLQIVFNLIYFFRFILLNSFCTPGPRLVTSSVFVGLLDLHKTRQICMARHCT